MHASHATVLFVPEDLSDEKKYDYASQAHVLSW